MSLNHQLSRSKSGDSHVTLILGMSKPEGIYLCVDFRVTDVRTGAVVDDGASKCLDIHFPSFRGGPPDPSAVRGLLAFTGVAQHPDGTPMLQWIRETLRGESEIPDQAMAHLLTRLNRDFARLRQPLIINFLGLQGDKRHLGALTNVVKTSSITLPRFGYVMVEIDKATFFGNGSGASTASADVKLQKAVSLLGVVPRQPMDYMRLIAMVNRRVATRERTVSPFSKVHFVSADSRFQSTAHTFVERGESTPFDMPVLLAGIDLTRQMRRLMDVTQAGGSLPPEGLFQGEDLKRRE
jgi:hypothetical protein